MARLEVFARTEVGCARERNEDTFLVLDMASGTTGLRPEERVRPLGSPGSVVAVCDGMGGAAAGDLAAKMAADTLRESVMSAGPIHTPDQAEQALLTAVTRANAAIADFTKTHPDKRGMGTTMTAAIVAGPTVVIIQVGDSRAYLRRGRTLQQLTMDQNVVGQMVAAGKLKPEDARNYKQRNVLLEAIGVQERVGPDLVRVNVQAGDVMLLCSDGLTGPIPDRQLLELMLRHEDPVSCCRALTEAACAAGGPDNVTAAVVRFLGEGLSVGSPDAPIEFARRPGVA